MQVLQTKSAADALTALESEMYADVGRMVQDAGSKENLQLSQPRVMKK